VYARDEVGIAEEESMQEGPRFIFCRTPRNDGPPRPRLLGPAIRQPPGAGCEARESVDPASPVSVKGAWPRPFRSHHLAAWPWWPAAGPRSTGRELVAARGDRHGGPRWAAPRLRSEEGATKVPRGLSSTIASSSMWCSVGQPDCFYEPQKEGSRWGERPSFRRGSWCATIRTISWTFF